MSKSLEIVKLAKENNASRFGDAFVSGVQERAATAVQERRTTMFAAAKVVSESVEGEETDGENA